MAACYWASITVITRFRAAAEPVAGELVNQNDGDRNARVASSIACDFKRSTDWRARGGGWRESGEGAAREEGWRGRPVTSGEIGERGAVVTRRAAIRKLHILARVLELYTGQVPRMRFK